MTWKYSLCSLLGLLLPAVSFAGPLAEKTPLYFSQRYGAAISSKTEPRVAFAHEKGGLVVLEGPFNVREYSDKDIRIIAFFLLPSLEPAAIRLAWPKPRTFPQLREALFTYGAKWKSLTPDRTVRTWVTSDGSKALDTESGELEFQSKIIAERIEQALAGSDAKQQPIPKP